MLKLEMVADDPVATLPDIPSLSLLGNVQTVASGNLVNHKVTTPTSPSEQTPNEPTLIPADTKDSSEPEESKESKESAGDSDRPPVDEKPADEKPLTEEDGVAANEPQETT